MESFKNGSPYDFVDIFDTDGNVINVSDGGIIFANGRYYWYGQAMRPIGFGLGGTGGQVTDSGVAMYSSADLLSWKYEGIVLSVSEKDERLLPPLRFERPKIIYNEKTKKYVLWCHYIKKPGDHSFLPGGGEALVAVSDSIRGPFKVIKILRPIDDGGMVRDCTLFKDADGKAYFIYDRDETFDVPTRCIHIVKLSDDYLDCTEEYKRIDACYRREAPAVIYRNGYYYMITSDMTAWEANKAKYFRAKNIMGEWEDMGDPYVGDTEGNSFLSQTTYAFKIEGEDRFIHMAERHNKENFLHCSYIWLPIDFDDDGSLHINYYEEWSL